MAGTNHAASSAAQANAIWIRLLGNLQVERSGLAQPLPASKRTRALLGYLVATAKPQTRQHLCELLWEGPDDPRAALRWSLTKLRPIVTARDAARLDTDRDRVQFLGQGQFADIAQVGELLAQGTGKASTPALEQAVSLLQGEFLDGLDLPHCYRFHHWCMAERERFGSLRRRALETLIERLSGDPQRSLQYARALVAADPLSEAAHGRFVDRLVAAGRIREADAHYEHARDLLRRELAVPLSGQLRRPVVIANEQRANAPRESAVTVDDKVVARAAMQTIARLVGRAAEMHSIESALRSLSVGPAPALLLFTGEPGIGKSRLLQAMADAAEPAGVAVASGRCFEPEMIRAYGLWIDVLREFPDGRGATRARTLSDPRLRWAAGVAEAGGTRDALFAEVADELRRMAKDRALVVLLDDLQWIDEGSASLLHYLLRVADSLGRVLFAGAAREGDLADNPWARRLLVSLERVRRVERHAIGPLSVAETASLFEDEVPESEAHARHRACGGNPLFALEMARRKEGGEPFSDDVFHKLVAGRIDTLDDVARELLQFASALGRPFAAELLGAAMDRSEVAVQAGLERHLQRGLLRNLPDGQYDFAHDLVRQATYQALPQPQRRMIHRRFARVLAVAASGDHRLYGDLAHQAGLAQDHVLAAEACIAAGERCLRLHANTEGERAADRGLAHLSQVDSATERVRLRVALLRLKTFAAGRPGILRRPQLMNELRELIGQAEGLELHASASLGSYVLSWVTQAMNDTGGVRAATLHAEAMSRTADAVTRCQQLANTGRCLLEVEQDVGRAREFLDEASALAERANQRITELDWGVGLVARWDGDLDAAHRMMSRAFALAQLKEDHWREIECLTWRAKIDLERGDFVQVAADAREIARVSERIGVPLQPVAETLRALAEYQPGERSARAALDNALAGLREFDDKANLAYVLNQCASIALTEGDGRRARLLADEALAAAKAVRRITETVVANALLVVASIELNDAAAARRHFTDLSALPDGRILSARAASALARARERVPESFTQAAEAREDQGSVAKPRLDRR